MKQLETRIKINASADTVWTKLMDFKSYDEWNPFIISIEGDSSKGSTLKIELTQDEKKTMKFEPLVLKSEPAQEFRWKGKLFIEGLFDGEHYFIIKSKTPNQTEFIHGEIFSGLLSGVLLKMIGKQTKAGFTAMNEALKSLSEKETSQTLRP